MTRDFKEYTIWDAVTPQTLTSSTDASPSVITKASHGLSTGDRVIIYGHTTNVAVNGIWDVEVINSSTFRLKDINTGDYVNGSGAGAGANGILATAPKVPLISDFRNAVLWFSTSGTATLTVKVAGSIGKLNGDSPNFGATVSASNPYSFLQIINLDTAAAVNGATGIAAAGTDLANQYELNINAMKYVTLVPTAWTQGAITAKLQVFNNR